MYLSVRATHRLGVSALVAAATLTATAASASAVSIDSLTTSSTYQFTGWHTYKLGPNGLGIGCNQSSAVGATHNVPGDPASTVFQPTLSSGFLNYDTHQRTACSDSRGAGEAVAATGDWKLSISGPADANGNYPVTFTGPVRMAQQFFDGQPSQLTCITTFDTQANANRPGLTASNAPGGGVFVHGTVTGLKYTVAGYGCFGSRPEGTFTDGTYTTGYKIPNVTITP